MDAVYTYVDGEDAVWREAYLACRRRQGASETTLSDIRCLDHGELAVSVHLLLGHCPWVRTVHVVHAGAGLAAPTRAALKPYLDSGRVSLVPQATLVPMETFSSCTVEAHLHHIPGLSARFLYSNDDMMVGRDMTPGDFDAADVSFFPQSEWPPPANMAEQHCDNTWAAFRRAHPTCPTPPCRAPHVVSVMSVAACRAAWATYPRELEAMCQQPLRSAHSTLNFQLLATLEGHARGLVKLRGATHRPGQRPRLAWALVEAEPAGFAHVLEQMPHRFCINGVDAASQGAFLRFAEQYLQRCEQGAYPRITQWSYAAHRQAEGDDRATGPPAP